MSDDTNTPGSFREHVQRLVEGGKLTAEEAAHLLEGEDAAPTPPSAVTAALPARARARNSRRVRGRAGAFMACPSSRASVAAGRGAVRPP